MAHRAMIRSMATAMLVVALIMTASPLLSAQTKPNKIRIAQTGHFLALASASVAWHKGYLRDEGLDAEVVIAPGRQGVLGLMSGEFQFRAGSPNDIMLMAEKGETMMAIVDIETYVDLPLVLRVDVAERLGVTPRDPVAKRLAAERYVLERDVPAMIEAAGKHWDWRMTGATSSAPQDE